MAEAAGDGELKHRAPMWMINFTPADVNDFNGFNDFRMWIWNKQQYKTINFTSFQIKLLVRLDSPGFVGFRSG